MDFKLSRKGVRILAVCAALFLWASAFLCVHMAYRQKNEAESKRLSYLLFASQLDTHATLIENALEYNKLEAVDLVNIVMSVSSMDTYLQESIRRGRLSETDYAWVTEQVDGLQRYLQLVYDGAGVVDRAEYVNLRADLLNLYDTFMDMVGAPKVERKPA